MTATFWLYTGLTVMFLAGVALAYWVCCRIADLLGAAELIRAHTEAGAQRATRAALDARAMLDEVRDESAILRQWWAEHTAEPDPETQPMERVGTDTVATARVIDEGMDEMLAAARARWDAIEAAPVEKPSPTARTRKKAAT